MSVTTPTFYPALRQGGAGVITLGGKIKGTDGDDLVQQSTFVYAKACRRAAARSWPSGLAYTVGSYITVLSYSFKLSAGRSQFDVVGWGNQVSVRVRIYRANGTTLQGSASASYTSGSPEAISLAVTSGVTQEDCVVIVEIQAATAACRLYSVALVERAVVI